MLRSYRSLKHSASFSSNAAIVLRTLDTVILFCALSDSRHRRFDLRTPPRGWVCPLGVGRRRSRARSLRILSKSASLQMTRPLDPLRSSPPPSCRHIVIAKRAGQQALVFEMRDADRPLQSSDRRVELSATGLGNARDYLVDCYELRLENDLEICLLWSGSSFRPDSE
jgi:hypothetical protein